MWIVVAAITFQWRHVAAYNAPWTWLPAIVFFSIGLLLYRASAEEFSVKQLGGLPEVLSGHDEQRLVTSGIRARVRHPIYLAHLCEMLGWGIGSGLLVCYGLAAFAVCSGAIMIFMEDQELEQRFGEAYRDYRKRVPAIVPRFSGRYW
ncbi:MAG: hypothetical protein NVS1B11_27220 [Terriglobales bacterium]